MSRPEISSQPAFEIVGDLEGLMSRLHPGLRVRGRIVDIIDDGKYILRIWGYNLLTASRGRFNRFDEIELVIREVEPHLVLDLHNIGRENHEFKPGRMDLLVY